MVVLAPVGPPMSRRVYLSHLDMPKGDFRYWPLTAHSDRLPPSITTLRKVHSLVVGAKGIRSTNALPRNLERAHVRCWCPSTLQFLTIIRPETVAFRGFPREWHNQYAQQRKCCQHRPCIIDAPDKSSLFDHWLHIGFCLWR